MGDHYGTSVESVYDLLYPPLQPEVVRRIADHATPGVIIEAGAGNGRLALPLIGLGKEVVAVDLSTTMLDKLSRGAEGMGLPIETVVGDITSPELTLSGGTVLCVNSTLFMLDTASAQRKFVNNVASWLSRGGRFIVETYNPLAYVPNEHTSQHFAILPDGASILFDEIISDRIEQSLTLVRQVRGATTVSFVERSRYCSSWELLAMAAHAGFEREHLWGDWFGAV